MQYCIALLQAFLPRENYQDKKDVSEEIFQKLIKQGRISEAHHVFKLLEDDISKDGKQAMLELLCFHNSDFEKAPEEFPEERSYINEVEISKNCWK